MRPLPWLVPVLLVAFPAHGLAQHIYKPARKALRDGAYDRALEIVEKKRRDAPKDSEWVVQRAIALAQLGRTDAAMESVRRAVSLGAPPARFVAEAQNLLRPLAKTEAFKEWASRHGEPIVHGPMLGDVTPRHAKVWVRTAGESTVTLTAEAASAKAVTAEATATEASDFTAVLQMEGLAPDTAYHYRVAVQSSEGHARSGRFRTPPRSGVPLRFDLAFGGGAGYVPENERMWSTIGRFDPSLLFLLGDNVYIDMPKHRSMQRFCYYRRHASPAFRALVADRPVYTIWDDHDFGTNDCWGGPQVAEPAWKPKVWEVFKQNWVNPAYGGGEDRPGCWYDFRYGDVHFILLDCRYYRTNPNGEDPTMLGPTQKAWLKQTVKASEATFKVLVSSVPWDFRTKGTSKDTWNGYRKERREIFSYLAEHRINGVVLMSADRHRSDAWRIARPDGYDLYELNSSRLTNRHVHATKEKAIFSYNDKQSFGLVTFDTTRSPPTVTYRVITIDGETVHELELSLADLSHDT